MRLERPIGHPDLCEFPGGTCPMQVDLLTERWKLPDVAELSEVIFREY